MLRTGEQSLTTDIIDCFHEISLETGLADAASLQALALLCGKARQRSGSVNLPESVQQLQNMVATANTMNADQLARASRLMALDSIGVNAARFAEEHASRPSPQALITAFLKHSLEAAPDPETAVRDLRVTLDSSILSLVHTLHPTIYHSPAARKLETSLTALLHQPEHVLKTGGTPRLSESGREAVRALLRAEMPAYASGKASVTPKQSTTVNMETQLEQENFARLRGVIDDIVQAWNASLADESLGLTAPLREALTLNERDRDRLFELRTWGRGADADGREKSTSELLFTAIHDAVRDSRFTGETFDLRQNAELHRDFFSALLQVKHRNSDPRRSGNEPDEAQASLLEAMGDPGEPGQQEHRRYGEDKQVGAVSGLHFDDFCSEFMKTREASYNGDWNGPRHSLFQQLNKQDRADFVTETIKEGFDLVPAQITTDVREFNSTMYPKKKEFLRQYAPYIRSQLRLENPQTITTEQMLRVSVPDGGGDKVSLLGKWNQTVKKTGWEMLHRGLQYNRLIPETSQQMQVANILQGTRKLDAEKSVVEMTEQDRATCMDTIKRLIVVNDAVSKYGPKVADRYQIANFSEPADFLIALKLFEEAGIAEIEKGTGRVKSTKLGIMPLLETREDMHNAREIFRALLKNDVARSYYKTRGMAEIMLGFSDGAATNGNFASQWEIYKVSRELTELFAKEGISVRFFQGRGRGTDRGGTIDPALQMQLMPPEVTRGGCYDATIQSDLPMDLAGAPSYGRDYITRLMLANFGAARKQPDPVEQGRLKGHEAAIEWIASRASEIYNKKVRNNPGVLDFFNNSPDNPYKSSRATARGKGKFTRFDKVRAIPKEYFAGAADLPMHNVGLSQAMREFSQRADIPVTTRSGETVTGAKALAALFGHPFFDAVTRTIRAGMEHYDPAVAEACGKITKSETFVAEVQKELRDLGGTLDYYAGRLRPAPREESPVPLPPSHMASALDQAAHAVILAGIGERGKPATPNLALEKNRQWGDTLLHALFTTVQEVGHRDLPAHYRDTPSRQAA